ncbi:MAG: beta-ketoacyl synthase chain length factor [Bacteroidales bacterium]|nr:beta-ketoacyl synthase chain length factor [Bacteroidales bacterium]
MDIFINGISAISPQNTIDNSSFLKEIKEYNKNQLNCIEPNYKEYLKPILARRMSRILKMSNVAAQISLKDACLIKPDAINTATGLGCMADTEKFLSSIINNDEKLLTPTSFIQSTHNTIGGQIALMLKVHGHNFTYVNGNSSFESALLDSIMLINDNEANNVLLGAADEITDLTHTIKDKLNIFKKEPVNNLKLLKYNSSGSIEGEGAAFFVLGNKKNSNYYAILKNISFLNSSGNRKEIEKHITTFVDSNFNSFDNLDLVISGYNGDNEYDKIYYELAKSIFANKKQSYYKHLCGEYMTSSSFAMWLAAQIAKTGNIPDEICLNSSNLKKPKNILIHNHHKNKLHTFILLSR